MTRAVNSLRLFAVLTAFGALAACASPAPTGFERLDFEQNQPASPNTFRG